MSVYPIDSNEYVKLEPVVGDEGIWVPEPKYQIKDKPHSYKCIMTREMFIEAYNKYIRDATDSGRGRVVMD